MVITHTLACTRLLRGFTRVGRCCVCTPPLSTGNVVSERPSDKVEGRLDRSSGYNYSECEATSYAEESRSRGTSYGWSDTSTDPTSAQSSSIPLDAHILAYWPHPFSAVLPFLCIAGEDDIFDLMSGLLYQRRAWGVVEPVIGIVLSTGGNVGRVVLGWSGEAICDPDVLPMVHFAYADGTRTDPSIGVYDLTDPESALKFAQFILNLRTHVEAVVAQCNQRVFKRLPWRSDTVDDNECGPEEQWEQRIIDWLHSVEGCRYPFPSASPLPSLRLSAGTMGSRPGRAPSRTASEPVHSYHTRSWDARGRSRLGAKALEGIGSGAKLSFLSYSHDRKMASIANIKLIARDALVDLRLVDEINHQLDFYEDMTRYLIPPIDLLMKTVSKRNEASERDSDDDSEVDPDIDNADFGPIKELDQEFWEIIAGSFSHLLWASVGAYTKLLGGKIHNEAKARHDWDALLNLGFVAPGEVASARLINTTQILVMGSAHPGRAEATTTVTIRLQAKQAVDTALEHMREVNTLFGSMDDAVQTIIKRGMAEPNFGICDAILMLSVDLRCKITEPLIRPTDTVNSLQAAKLKMLTDDKIEEQQDHKTSIQRKAPSTSEGQSRGSKSATSSRRGDLGSITEEHDGLELLVQNRTPAQKLLVKEKDLQNPFAVTCSETSFDEPERLPMAVIDIQELLTRLLLAVLVAEYKKPTTSYKKALYQVKMYLEASVRYLVQPRCITSSRFCFSLRRDSDTRLKELVEGVVGTDAFIQTSWNKTAQYERYPVEENIDVP
ncbi:hypothetical protein F5146DRAFT_998056 [Armillaria mellea]|nr:hypothetical protein F5146DRAFT_998056 [Armillaria mellea]